MTNIDFPKKKRRWKSQTMLCKRFTFTNVPPNTRPPPRWCSLNAFVRLSLFNGTTKPFQRLYPSHTAHRTKQMSSSCWENVYSKKREGKKPQWHLQMRGNWNPSWKAPSMLFWLQTEKKERTRNNGSVRTIFFFFYVLRPYVRFKYFDYILCSQAHKGHVCIYAFRHALPLTNKEQY